ncbi:DUF4357 domain-containing protein [uncultured Mobiluncus sp.]|uniref:DUF4357 domain-containing protein n=1 Tax=uncultured Mobiluncus sp. TaxID=293425 RepID=UPI0025E137F2|nr:DUF4357 domain-containing protein [uncultured Mobiluncus sp.]
MGIDDEPILIFQRKGADAKGQMTSEGFAFTSPSAAASFVGGGTLSGNATWKTNEGIFLGQLLI